MSEEHILTMLDKKNNNRVVIAMSGGVDSSVSAALLRDQGYDVIGVSLQLYDPVPRDAATKTKTCCSLDDVMDAARVAKKLGIPFEVLDLRKEFRELVVADFITEYAAGRTPNPCIRCNERIKFELLLEKAREMGAERLATGHYARITVDSNGTWRLLKGIDPMKDQSYFLSRMTQTQLAHACFPLGGMTKSQVVQLAKDLELEPVHHGESQDICFIKGRTYGEFLANQEGFVSSSGPIATVGGKIIGEHPGLHLFTIGQRRGINCPAAQPYYVVRLDPKANMLVVGFKSDLLVSSCGVSDINWITGPPAFPARVYTRVRYRSEAVCSTLIQTTDGVTVVFDVLQPSVTPGQGAVFYREDNEVLGGGWICEDLKQRARSSS